MSSTPETAEKRTTVSNLHAGMVHMKSPTSMEDALTVINTVADAVQTEPNNLGFDVFYINAPWKSLDVEYLQSLPLDKLCNPSSATSLLMWVDGNRISQANDLLNWWGFDFHSVIHCSMYESGPDGAKTTSPHGWDIDGINAQRVRQLWYAVRSAPANVAENNELPALTKTIRDASFVRRRMPQTSSFVYTRMSDHIMTTLSSKKKELDRWTLYPDMCAFSLGEIDAAIDKIIRPSSRVMHLFAQTVNPTWFCWGPNVPTYISSPMRGADVFDTTLAIAKYFTGMRLNSVQRYMSFLNLHAVSLARKLGGKTDDAAMSVVETRLCDFFVDVHRRFNENGGSHRTSPLTTTASPLNFDTLLAFKDQDAITQTAILRLTAQVVSIILARTQEAADKKAAKRKAAAMDETVATEEGEEGSVKPPAKKRSSGRHGIASPVPITKELASFMGLGDTEMVARTAAVRFINSYIVQNSLQNPGKRSEIIMDDKLRALLNPPADFGPVTFFGMSKLLVPHFPKNTAAASSTTNAIAETA